MVDNNHRKGLRSKKSEERRVKKEEFKSEKRNGARSWSITCLFCLEH